MDVASSRFATGLGSRGIYALGLLLAAVPLWVGRHLPMVDLPQHLYLISVLHRLDDPTTLYPQLFAMRGDLTPYLGYYHLVSALNWVLPLTIANKVFLTGYVVGLPLALGFLLRGLGRPRWPSLLAVPFAYGDSFAWGFVNYVAAIPLALLCCGFLVRAVSDASRRARWAAGLCASLVLVLLFHVQVFAFLGLALPALLLTTAAPGDRTEPGSPLKRRGLVVAALVPGAILFFAWVGLRLGQSATVEYGAPWKAWGPLLSAQNLSYKSFAQNWEDLFQVLANMLRDQSDRYALYGVAAVCIASLILAGLGGAKSVRREGPVERWRMAILAAIALAMFFALPFDIRGSMYYLNTRFAHLAAPLAVAALPALEPKFRGFLLTAAAICSLVLAVPLARGFSSFNQEASALDELAPLAGQRPMVMGLIFDTGSRAVRHPVFLHSAAVIAREQGGAPNFTFALTPHSPLRYRGPPPPTFPSEWRPDQFNYEREGRAYDHFLLRGIAPRQVFGPRLGAELAIAGQAGGFWLVGRR